jgi:hypothetical protein
MNCRQMSKAVLPHILGLDPKQAECSEAVLYGERGRRGFCGLVETTLTFICAHGREKGRSDAEIRELCEGYILGFEQKFGHHLCGKLRPKYFDPEKPREKCMRLVLDAIRYNIEFVSALG